MAMDTREKATLVDELGTIVGSRHVLSSDYDLMLYEYDASIDRARPDVVVFPASTAEVSAIVQLANQHNIPFTARGAGTGLSGGAVPLHGGIIIAFQRMNRILSVDYTNMRAIVQPGVVNLHLSNAMTPQGFYYVPDPSSQKSCTIGGNVGENSGGPHTLIYGVTTNHVLGLEVVLPDGEIIEVGAPTLDTPGYDLTGLLVGSEGTLGIVTSITVRIVHQCEAVKTLVGVFNSVDDATNTVSGIVEAGIIPAALEMMDQIILQAVEDYIHAGYPRDAAAVLLIEVEGLHDTVDEQVRQVTAVCEANHARAVRIAQNEQERQLLWAGRKEAFGAVGRVSPEFYVQDGVVPRTKLPVVLDRVNAICAGYGLRVGNVFHAGDGNLHPLILFDSQIPGQVENVRKAGFEILQVCADAGGTITGEHGVGMEKSDAMPLIFNEDDLSVMTRVRDAFNPRNLCNPGKIFPTPGRCADIKLVIGQQRSPAYAQAEADGAWH